jgi:hypothetical protein
MTPDNDNDKIAKAPTDFPPQTKCTIEECREAAHLRSLHAVDGARARR